MALHSISDSGRSVRFDQGTHDLRNYEVRTKDSNKVGTVDDVLVDDRGRTRYLCMKHDSGDRHTLIPAGSARTDRENRRVNLSTIDRDSFSNAPKYSHDPSTINDDYERRLASAYDERHTDERFYDRSDYNSGWGRGTDEKNSGRLERLDKLDDYKVADGEPDPRGWKMIGRGGKTLGKVDHLVGDTTSMRVRYLVVELDDSIDEKNRNVLIPVGHVDLDTSKRNVVTRGLDATCVGNIPAYTGGPVSRDYENTVMTTCESAYEGANRYEHPRYKDEDLWDNEESISVAEEELKVGTRERKAGEVDLHKSVETEHVRKPVNVHHEEVEVERRPVTGKGSEKAEFKDREVKVPIVEEEVVVEKRPRVTEEIVVRKRDVEDTEYVDETVRREHVEVEDDRRPNH